MMNTPNTANIRKDVYLLGNTLLRLGLPRLIIRLVVLLSVLALLLYCVQGILARGKGWLEFVLHVSGLNEILGKTVIDFVMQYQKFFWWFIAALLVLFVLSALMSWVRGSIKRGRSALVPLGEFRKLCAGLSPEALDVLNWVWRDQSTPITVGNLQTTLSQLRTGRTRKLDLARAQKLELELALTPKDTAPPANPLENGGQREPTLLA
ncbi:hypothetical protein [Zwartia panacis]|uniref:hypothetical protein n=1 Tax=Zwartia panacis TaxID=2683345 RepID=UPI0025B52C89|nr:hypothetical protein [Zwartia panacis]MDN4017066.1 hypothetical protein [Zwartia panacis]